MPKLTVSIDGVVIKEIELTQERTTLGRRPYNDIVIDNLAVSGEHAVFVMRNGQVTIDDLHSTNGTYVNGRAIRSEVLHDNDQLDIGRYKIRFFQPAVAEAPAATAPAEPTSTAWPSQEVPAHPQPPAARIRVLSGPAAGREAPLVKVVTTLGKPGVAVAAITQRANGYTIATVDGTISPKVNGQPLGDEPLTLRHDDVIELADTQVRFLQD